MSNENPLVRSVRQTLHKHRMIDTSDTILVGVSGGADSVCLLHILHALGLGIGVGHVNHGWRGQASDDDEHFVRRLAARLGVPFYTQGPGVSGSGNLEAEARTARKRFFDQFLTSEAFTKVALAHSRNDRSETLLLNLLRGAGPEGLVSMSAVAGRVIRPLIESTRDQIEAYLRTIGQDWRDDRTNSDLDFARNRIRHVVLPTLAADFNPNLIDALARTVELLEDENEWMKQKIDEWLLERCREDEAGVVLRIDDLAGRPVAFARRVLRESLRRAGSALTDVSFDHLESVRSLLEPGKSGKVIELPGAIAVERNFDTLVFAEGVEAKPDYEYELEIPGRVHVPEIGCVIEARLASPADCKPKMGRALVDGESLGPCVRIRNWRNGDFYSPVGLPAAKLKKLFQDERVPRRQRHRLPVLVAESSIVWVASFPVSREFAPTGHSRRIIEFEALPQAPGE